MTIRTEAQMQLLRQIGASKAEEDRIRAHFEQQKVEAVFKQETETNRLVLLAAKAKTPKSAIAGVMGYTGTVNVYQRLEQAAETNTSGPELVEKAAPNFVVYHTSTEGTVGTLTLELNRFPNPLDPAELLSNIFIVHDYDAAPFDIEEDAAVRRMRTTNNRAAISDACPADAFLVERLTQLPEFPRQDMPTERPE